VAGAPFVDADYDADEWFRRAKGMEFCPERGTRCSVCFARPAAASPSRKGDTRTPSPPHPPCGAAWPPRHAVRTHGAVRRGARLRDRAPGGVSVLCLFPCVCIFVRACGCAGGVCTLAPPPPASTTTNATSRWKDADQVNESGVRAAAKYPGVRCPVTPSAADTFGNSSPSIHVPARSGSRVASVGFGAVGRGSCDGMGTALGTPGRRGAGGGG